MNNQLAQTRLKNYSRWDYLNIKTNQCRKKLFQRN